MRQEMDGVGKALVGDQGVQELQRRLFIAEQGKRLLAEPVPSRDLTRLRGPDLLQH